MFNRALSLSDFKSVCKFLILSLVFISCKSDPIILNGANSIIAVNSNESEIIIEFDSSSNQITFTVPYDFDLSSVHLETSISEGATIFPSNQTINLQNLSAITVTAENGDIQVYDIVINRLGNSENFINSFEILDGDETHTGLLDHDAGTIQIELPSTFDFASFAPNITISENAAIASSTFETLDFDSIIDYTITSEDGKSKVYKLTIIKVDNSENKIIAFYVSAVESLYVLGEVDQVANIINLKIPYTFDLTSLVVSATISPFSEISPALDNRFDFTKDVKFTITAENGEEREYSILVERDENEENYITSFEFPTPEDSNIAAEYIDDENNLIHIQVPFGFDLTELTPQIEISENATISPQATLERNFENPITYDVTSEKGVIKTYTVSTTIAPNSENLITEFTIPNNDDMIIGIIDNLENSVTVNIPFDFEINNLTSNIIVSENATVAPASGVTQNFNEENTLIVTAENGNTRDYTVVFVRAPNVQNMIISFTMPNGESSIQGVVDNDANTITLSFPFGFDPNGLVPEIVVSENAAVVASSINGYHDKISYLVTAENGDKRIYKTIAVFEKNSANFVTSFLIEIENEFQQADIDNNNNTITVSTSLNTDLTDVNIYIMISENSTINSHLNYQELNFEGRSYIVTAENGNEREYDVVIVRTASTENLISSFLLTIDSQVYVGQIDQENNTIQVNVPTGSDLQNLVPQITTSSYATIFPSTDATQNFDAPITYTVSAENGDVKDYVVNIGYVDNSTYTESFSIACDETSNFSQWFGGDDRESSAAYPDFGPRNVGGGQTIIVEEDVLLSNFSFLLIHGFGYIDSPTRSVPANVAVQLDVRNENGVIIESKIKTIPTSFSSLWVDFDLSDLDLVLLSNVKYIFTMHLVNGEALEINTGIAGTTTPRDEATGNCFYGSYSGTSREREGTDLANWETWYEKNEPRFN
ncbi:MAG: hypothetical protein C7M88_07645, partial [Candidatus Arcticimaribacter sp.]